MNLSYHFQNNLHHHFFGLNTSLIQIDDILIDQLLTNKLEYIHDFNGSQSTVKDKFYGVMGCNGTAEFEFTTPFYLWLLENM